MSSPSQASGSCELQGAANASGEGGLLSGLGGGEVHSGGSIE